MIIVNSVPIIPIPKITPFFQYRTFETWAGFHNHLIWLKFNPNYFMQNFTYFRQNNQECKKTEYIFYLWIYIYKHQLYLWCYIPMDEGIFQWMTVYTNGWRYISMDDGIYQWMTVYSNGWQYISMDEGIYQWMTVYTNGWRYISMDEGIYQWMKVYSNGWQFISMDEGIFQWMTVYING